MKCQKCGTEYAKNEVKCSNCGEQLRAPDKIFRLRFWVIVGSAVLMLILFLTCIIADSNYEMEIKFRAFSESIGIDSYGIWPEDIVFGIVEIYAVGSLIAFIFNMISHTKLKNGSCGFFCVLFMIIPLLEIPYAVATVKANLDLYGTSAGSFAGILCGIFAVCQLLIFIEGLRIRSVQVKVQAHYRENSKLKA